ncbi:ergothioneine biosynthesis protein EgtB [Flavobacterium sp. S87F.05.LMB.W.Kidney.N]|uniref:ergothioneine biosynthesis protein EgtB n=1 Tax=Flavobacterium sp. S87F.05.LMB.W.Kidney.N TaxID=1278758 RepID=UPI0010658897|nr:ergothioneine biosynthesis protein EgtB [Flavobacterium sp. S87F.05.LMB.W.Kidney.N]TDX08386.1 ergothioneine biosynthesis protein EgtB [Flavobacterium sp. S87F.05.LMB.W.Kidney.N]
MEQTAQKNDALLILSQYKKIRRHSETICRPLEIEDYVVQPIADVSPPKWHLGHTTWFFETFILIPNFQGYKEFNPQYNFVFNSYYETVGARVVRTDRGNLSRPSVADIYAYRAYVDEQMEAYLNHHNDLSDELYAVLELGLNHEQQHQELLLTDIKYILGHNPLFPVYKEMEEVIVKREESPFIAMPEDIYEIGFNGTGFSFDNEYGRHKKYLEAFEIASSLVTNEEYLQFMEEGGYENFKYWHSEGWDWVTQQKAKAPLYWHSIDGKWQHYTLSGLQNIDPLDLVCHVNFYEASAFAAWKGMRLPTEEEWEASSSHFNWGERWEWTGSAYLPYPRYKKEAGAIGEYNGKFMVNQMVLRGASIATPQGHSRSSYRNFFHPKHQWQFSGIRLVK